MQIVPRLNLLPQQFRSTASTNGQVYPPPIVRFWTKVNKLGPIWNGTPCWIWEACIQGDGYGSIRIDGRMTLAHKWYWEQSNGPVPDGKELDHLCNRRACCNLGHLEAVTHLENMRRGIKGRQTHCKRGHEFTIENIYSRPRNLPTNRTKRVCRACKKICREKKRGI